MGALVSDLAGAQLTDTLVELVMGPGIQTRRRFDLIQWSCLVRSTRASDFSGGFRSLLIKGRDRGPPRLAKSVFGVDKLVRCVKRSTRQATSEARSTQRQISFVFVSPKGAHKACDPRQFESPKQILIFLPPSQVTNPGA
jgi:hypothetical protein